MITYQFLLLHSSEISPSGIEEKIVQLVGQDGVWTDSNYYGTQPYLICEEKDETGSVSRRITVKSSLSTEGYPLIPEIQDSFSSIVQLVRKGAWQEVKDQPDLKLTLLMLETDEATDRKAWIRLIEQVLVEVIGIVVYPEIMRLQEFRSFFSLQRDVVEVDKEPEDFTD